ncbi:hypothetical protein Stube_36660 [Streptomyces tubercidicus]|uniref:Uncharacterized protein n=1 Tax=Streptomyces tubercidicus TaxID=47759 RepID=A0A640USJ1_9ACTN|nr:hypothetical protein Stube_36660 [Streptomyces tubercidicus]
MSERGSDPKLDEPVSFRPAGLPIGDREVAQIPPGYDGRTAAEDAAQPGVVTPPTPTEPAPTEALVTRLRRLLEEEG